MDKIKELAKVINTAKEVETIWQRFNDLFPDELGEVMEEQLSIGDAYFSKRKNLNKP